MTLLKIVVSELPASCWACDFKYNDDYVNRCPLLEKEFFFHVRVDEYRKERHFKCPLEDAGL